MSGTAQQRRSGSRRTTPGVITCPACAGPLKVDSKWCPACQFTGSQTVDLFPDEAPPLLPVLDAVGLLPEDGIRKITAAMDRVRAGFPQFHWKVCIVNLPAGSSLPVFGFWLLNASPLYTETVDERAWTVLLLINEANGQAAVIPGYGAEPFLADQEWKTTLALMVEPWRSGKPVDAVLQFFKGAQGSLKHAWKRYGARRSGK